MVIMSGGGYVVIISLYMRIFNIYLQYIQFLFANYVSIKSGRKRKRKEKKKENHQSRVTYVNCTSIDRNAVSKNIKILFTPNYTKYSLFKKVN